MQQGRSLCALYSIGELLSLSYTVGSKLNEESLHLEPMLPGLDQSQCLTPFVNAKGFDSISK